MASGGMVTPRCGSEINEAWLQHMLTCYERRRDPEAALKVINHRVRPGTKPGENVASEVIKIWAEVELTVKKDEEESKEGETKREEEKGKDTTTTTTTTTTTSRKEYNLVAKFNQGTEIDIEFAKYSSLDLNELLIYSDVITHLNTWQEQVLRERGEEGQALHRFKVQVPEFVYGVCTYNEYVLVMQDVSVLGYTTEDKTQGLDLPHVLMAADRLARIHALSHAFHRAHDFLHHYPTFSQDERLQIFFLGFMFVFVDFVLEMAKQRPEFVPIVEKIRANEEGIKARLLEAMKRDHPRNRVVCLGHGDYWTNNLMFSHEGTTKTPQDLMIIDWGLLDWRNAILDLHQLVYNCTTLSLRRQHLQDILQRYHNTFTAATTALGQPVEGYTFEEMMKEYRRTAIFGLFRCGLFASAVVLSKKAKDGFQKGTPSTGLTSMALRLVGKVMVYLFLNGWFKDSLVNNIKKSFQPLLEEMLSGENQVLNSRLLELLEEANQEGVLED